MMWLASVVAPLYLLRTKTLRQQHLLGGAGMHLCSHGSRLALLNARRGLLFGLGTVGGYHCLIHFHDVAQHHNREVVVSNDKQTPCRSSLFPVFVHQLEADFSSRPVCHEECFP